MICSIIVESKEQHYSQWEVAYTFIITLNHEVAIPYVLDGFVGNWKVTIKKKLKTSQSWRKSCELWRWLTCEERFRRQTALLGPTRCDGALLGWITLVWSAGCRCARSALWIHGEGREHTSTPDRSRSETELSVDINTAVVLLLPPLGPEADCLWFLVKVFTMLSVTFE